MDMKTAGHCVRRLAGSTYPGADPGFQVRGAHLKKLRRAEEGANIFGVVVWYPKIGENMIFWRKIVIFHTKYPKNFRASLRNWKK
jgi:hypothetical protein